MGFNNLIIIIIAFFLIKDIFSGHAPGLISLLLSDPFLFIFIAIPLLYSIIFHELAHGWVAEKMGDSTARWLGRISLNPLKHLDPLGTFMLFFSRFGWAKPVPINPNNFYDYRKGLILVSSAGIIANFILAFISYLLLGIINPRHFSYLEIALNQMGEINIILAAFNLIPIPPLDGSKILIGFSPPRVQYSLAQIEPYGMFIIIFLLFSGLMNFLFYPFVRIITTLLRLILP